MRAILGAEPARLPMLQVGGHLSLNNDRDTVTRTSGRAHVPRRWLGVARHKLLLPFGSAHLYFVHTFVSL